jgi:transcription-repair coupling factor (superfamily II helicase)
MTSYSELIHFLRTTGYEEVADIHSSGEFVVRGDLIELWPVSSDVRFRLHYFTEDLEKVEKWDGSSWKLTDEEPVLQPNQLETEHGKIRPGDYIVHPFHGVGIFGGIVTRQDFDGNEESYVSLLYAGNDRLLVPVDRQDGLMPYIGSRHPRLTRLYSKAWANTKERIKRDLIAVARGLLKVYAARQMSKRPRYPHANEWLIEVAKGVSFELTEDQEKSLKEIQHDLEKSDHPMDRLLCGDVGFGKTEVALRAAVEVMAAGKQVAFIAPTTVLVEQHYSLLKERFKGLPVRVDRMARVGSSTGQPTLVKERLAEGSVDLVVGTHRLLGKGITYKDLGLLIIDEEQKFGVSQKERLKDLRPHLDVLSLSATPIPRTLSMSLSGLRGLSMLRTAPKGRKPIKTEVEAYSDTVFAQALADEVKRGGQVYVVHNRVQSLPYVEAHVRKLLDSVGCGNAKVAIVHGQLHETELAKSMFEFLSGKVDVLVASSIVEHGLDSPKANTLIVLHSERFGLSDLYQLRGRVGRRAEQAYAYFFMGGVEQSGYDVDSPMAPVSTTAKLRLDALKEADILGSGWSIALRDLEIRGGGNILGNEQHGNLESIGLLLYAQLLQEEIGRQAVEQGIPLFLKSNIQE